VITSLDNPKVKWMRQLLDVRGRRSEGCYLLEGMILLRDALDAGVMPRLVLFTSSVRASDRWGRELLTRLDAVPHDEVSPAIMRSLTDTVTPQGIVAAVPIPQPALELPAGGLAIVLDGLRDPGNVGSILRSAQAAGCVAVLATPDTVDFYSPKVVRAAMGAHFRLRLLPDLPWTTLERLLVGRTVYVADARAPTPYFAVDWTPPGALVIGSETEGTRPEAQRCATGRVSIPMPGRMDSLNAAIAASIIMFEAVRQRQQRDRPA